MYKISLKDSSCQAEWERQPSHAKIIKWLKLSPFDRSVTLKSFSQPELVTAVKHKIRITFLHSFWVFPFTADTQVSCCTWLNGTSVVIVSGTALLETSHYCTRLLAHWTFLEREAHGEKKANMPPTFVTVCDPEYCEKKPYLIDIQQNCASLLCIISDKTRLYVHWNSV